NPYVRGAAAEGFETLNYSNQEYDVKITDARPNKGEYTIDTHGFAYHDDPYIDEATLEVLRANDKAEVSDKYYPMVERLVKEKTGATKVVVFDHTLRRRQPALAKTDNPNGKEQPASLLRYSYLDLTGNDGVQVHCDQSAVGAIRRVHRHLGQEAERLLQGRAQIINVWRPLRGPVEEWPLATMDGRSLHNDNVHPTNIFKHQYDLQGQTVSISHSPEQRWHYLKHQNTNEVTFIKIWDSKEDVEAKLCAHCAFPDPDSPKNAALRESMEVRCIVFYEV
ncbi:S-adenosyl-L-methionine-dependent methyltransferase, partial [Apiospora kogelbergensis]|uniref:S-adenosyl-L-methionine-dependent methyltransferase n=1 Tax=Apiospora kogelbergensis TaxID=1337665 RepID=UPI00312F61A9